MIGRWFFGIYSCDNFNHFKLIIFFLFLYLQQLQTLVREGILNGTVRPLSRVTYAPHEVSRAFHLLAESRHRGRVLLRFQDQHPLAQPRYKTYIRKILNFTNKTVTQMFKVKNIFFNSITISTTPFGTWTFFFVFLFTFHGKNVQV